MNRKRIISFFLICLFIISSDTTVIKAEEDFENFRILEFEELLQNPELPSGCEVTSLTAVMNYYGFDVDKVEMARKYLPKQDFYRRNGVRYGADFLNCFAGDPEDKGGYGCYAPCIEKTANAYLEETGNGVRAKSLIGIELEQLMGIVKEGKPVIIWITQNLMESKITTGWTTPEGEKVKWRQGEHCVVMIGYDTCNLKIYVMDPLEGIVDYDMKTFKNRYEEMGSYAVVIDYCEQEPKEEENILYIDGIPEIFLNDNKIFLYDRIEFKKYFENMV